MPVCRSAVAGPSSGDIVCRDRSACWAHPGFSQRTVVAGPVVADQSANRVLVLPNRMAPQGQLLVDFIWRRRPGTAEVRVSSFTDGHADIQRSVQRWDPGEPPGAVAGCLFNRNGSSGSVGPASWDLRFEREPAQLLVPPGPLRWARALDVSVASWPMCSATGHVRVGADNAVVDHRRAMTCHYWGRQLPREWVWLSANDFDRSGVAVEVALMRSALWGVGVPLPAAGYAWLRNDGRESLVPSPLTGLVTRRDGSRTAVDVAVRSLRERFWLRAAAPRDSFVNLGDGITQSLNAHCEIRLSGAGSTNRSVSAALEFRGTRRPRIRNRSLVTELLQHR